MKVQIFGIGWYEKDDYAAILKIMSDKHVLPATYRDWKQKAERLEAETKAKGVTVVRAIIDPKAFPAWCTIRGMKIDAEARMLFASEYAYKHGRQ
ncbi:hypothetical protein G3A39_42535 [Paraburkholderia aspalathi]|nr:hypothetical protein [Paraburkholderia aspalathi]